jgi:hypothetical protein
MSGGSSYRWIWILLAPVCLPAFGGTEALSDGLRRCGRESDQTQRLACFDALLSSLPKIEADRFGMTADVAEKRNPGVFRPQQNEALTGKIVALREGAQGRLIFTLDNGQVWAQTEARPSIRFAVGDAVRLEHGSMSSLWLAADHDRKTRVKRIS